MFTHNASALTMSLNVRTGELSVNKQGKKRIIYFVENLTCYFYLLLEKSNLIT